MERTRVLPNFLVIGAQRAGSTLVHELLANHPQVYVPHQRKEIHFFDWYYGRGEDWYRKFFPLPADAARFRAVGEVTPDYLAVPEVPQRIHQLIPHCRLVVILRNPVDRAYSWYLYARRGYNERRDFPDFLCHDPTALEWGLYSRHLERYLAHFPRTSLAVLIYEELIADPATGLNQLSDFLDISADWTRVQSLLGAPVNTSRAPRFRTAFSATRKMGHVLMRHDFNWPVRAAKQLGLRRIFGTAAKSPEMDPALRNRLASYYELDIRHLEAILQRKLSVWTQRKPYLKPPSA